MNHWLVKSEPFKYSWAQFVRDGQTFWDGVRSYPARLHLIAMKKGDTVLFYHSNEGLEVVGIARVAREAYPDPTAEEGNWVAVDLEAVKPLKKGVSLAAIKATPELANMALIKQSRLSVSPVRPEEYACILKMGGL